MQEDSKQKKTHLKKIYKITIDQENAGIYTQSI